MELVRTTEAAALAAARWMGRGEKEGADAAAVDAMRVVLQTVSMDGVVVIGEGEKDRAPMLFNGEAIGDGSPPQTDIAVDPIEGTTLTALGRGGALSVIAVSDRGTMFDPGPCVYMEKLAVGPRASGSVDLTRSPTENVESVAKALGKSVRDVTAVVLDRPRHTRADRRGAGERSAHQAPRARRRRRGDIDCVAGLRCRHPLRGREVLPKGVLAAAAIKCMGGMIQGKLWPRDDDERDAAIEPATTSTRSSTPTISCAGTIASSPRPGSPTVSSSKVCGTTTSERRHSRS